MKPCHPILLSSNLGVFLTLLKRGGTNQEIDVLQNQFQYCQTNPSPSIRKAGKGWNVVFHPYMSDRGLLDFVLIFVSMLVFVFVFVSMLLLRWPIVAGAANCDELQLDHHCICSVDICKVQNAKLARNGWKKSKRKAKVVDKLCFDSPCAEKSYLSINNKYFLRPPVLSSYFTWTGIICNWNWMLQLYWRLIGILKIQLQFVPIKVANHPLNAAVIKVFCAKLNDLVSHSSVSSNALKQTNEVVTFFFSQRLCGGAGNVKHTNINNNLRRQYTVPYTWICLIWRFVTEE